MFSSFNEELYKETSQLLSLEHFRSYILLSLSCHCLYMSLSLNIMLEPLGLTGIVGRLSTKDLGALQGFVSHMP